MGILCHDQNLGRRRFPMKPGDLVLTIGYPENQHLAAIYVVFPSGLRFESHVEAGLMCLVLSVSGHNHLEVLLPSGKCCWLIDWGTF
jgi:hypothetical protein